MKILKDFFEIASWYWLRKDSLKSWAMLAVTLGFSLAIIEVSVYMNKWNKEFYDALSEFKKELIVPLVFEFLLYTALIVIFIVCGNWFKKLLIIDWRENLSSKMETLWIQNSNFYRANFKEKYRAIDNPDQRIAEDSFLIVDKSIDLLKSLVYNVAKLFAFTTILWDISKVINFSVLGKEIELSGFLVYIAIAYTLISSLITHFLGRKLRDLNYEKQSAEANYRANLIITRENAEAVAFLKGGEREKSRFRNSFADIMRNWRSIMNTEFRLECFSASYLKITNLIPIFACLPLYFARTMSFGDMMQARSAFYSVQDGLAWFMDYYKRIMEWAASVERIYQFASAMRRIDEKSEFKNDQESVIGENLVVKTPQNQPLVANLNFTLKPSAWLMLSGKSGSGKSTLLRYIAGIWEFGSGNVSMPKEDVMFIPQKPYLAKLSLKELISYPSDANESDEKFIRILDKVGLGKFKDSLNLVDDYAKILSGGEAQRLNFARIYFHEPKFIFMDEATSALDTISAKELLSGLKADFKELGAMAAIHQDELKDMFDEIVEIKQA